MLLNHRLNRRRHRTKHLINLLPILEKDKSRHRPHAQLLRDIGTLVDVDFIEADVWVCFGELDEFGGDSFARAAPGCEAVYDD